MLIKRGRLRFRAEGLAEPLEADRADINFQVGPAPGPVKWKVALARQAAGNPADDATDTIGFQGNYQRWWEPEDIKPPQDVDLTIVSRRWPWKLDTRGLNLTTELDGDLAVVRQAGVWTVRGEASARGDLADLARSARSSGGLELRDLDGPWSARVRVDPLESGWRIGGTLDIPDLRIQEDGNDAGTTPRRSEGPIGLTLRADYRPGQAQVELAELVASSRYAVMRAAGRIDDLNGARQVDLHGTIEPDWKLLNDRLAEQVEPGARVNGRPRPFRISGTLAKRPDGQWLDTLEGEIGLDLERADIFGLNLGPTPLVLRAAKGKVAIDPIETTLNGGRLHAEPTLILDGPDGPVLMLGAESKLVDAQINEEVSHRFLSFVAPVIDNATRATGRVSVDLKEAVFPLSSDSDLVKTAKVEGAVLFRDAEFSPGPLADQLFDLIGLRDRPSLKLNDPVALTIADRRVYQHGLKIPLGQLNTIEVEGWVDFDRQINLTASVPLLPTMLGDRPILSDVLGGLQIKVPVRGTLARPEVDRDAFNLAMKDLGKSLLERTATKGAADLLQKLFQPRDPNAPPPLTREERRARRQERRMQP